MKAADDEGLLPPFSVVTQKGQEGRGVTRPHDGEMNLLKVLRTVLKMFSFDSLLLQFITHFAPTANDETADRQEDRRITPPGKLTK